MKLSPETKELVDEFIEGLDAAGKAYAMDCLKGKAVDKNDPEEKNETKAEKEEEGHIPLDEDKMFEDEIHDNPEHKAKSKKPKKDEEYGEDGQDPDHESA